MTTTEPLPLSDVPELPVQQIPMGADRGAGWAAMRAAGPLVRVDGWLYATHRDDVVAALRDAATWSSEQAFDTLGSPLPLVPLAFDPPEHTRFRKILQPFFSPRALGLMLPALQAQAVGLIDAVAGRDRVDAVAEVAVPYPSQVFLTFFGLPLEDRDQLLAWKDAVIAAADSDDLSDEEIQRALDLSIYLDAAIRNTRDNPGDHLLSHLLQGDSAGEYEPLDDGEALGLAFLFVLAGLDTVTASLGFALARLAQDPDLRRRLVADPEEIAEFAEEIVRLEPPAPMLPRMTTRDAVFGGYAVPKGTLVRMAVGAINREDDGLHPTPDGVTIDGKPHKHWGFGGGPHRCLGSHLARMELKLLLGEWLSRIPDFSLAADEDLLMPYPANTFGLRTLRLTLGKATS